DLSLELNAMGSVLRHGLSSFESPTRRSIHSQPPVRLQGPIPKRRPFSALTHFWWNWMSVGSRSPKGIDIVRRDFSPSTLVPRGLVVEGAMLDGSSARITVRATLKASVCPGCGTPSERVHSRYRRPTCRLQGVQFA